MVIIFVGWLLLIIIFYFVWGQFDVSMEKLYFYDFMLKHGDLLIKEAKASISNRYKNIKEIYIYLRKRIWELLEPRLNKSQKKKILLKIDEFLASFLNFCIKIVKNVKPFLKILIIIIATIYFLIQWYHKKSIYDYVRMGYLDLILHSTIIEYFVWDSAFNDRSRRFSPTAKRSLFLVGSFCLKRGFYMRYYETILTLPHFRKSLVFPPISAYTPLISILKIDVKAFIERREYN